MWIPPRKRSGNSASLIAEGADYLLGRLGLTARAIEAFDALVDGGFEGNLEMLCDLSRAAAGYDPSGSAPEHERDPAATSLTRLPARLRRVEVASAAGLWHLHSLQGEDAAHPFFVHSAYHWACRHGSRAVLLALVGPAIGDEVVLGRLAEHREVALRTAIVRSIEDPARAASLFADDQRVDVARARAVRRGHSDGIDAAAQLLSVAAGDGSWVRVRTMADGVVSGAVRTFDGSTARIDDGTNDHLVEVGGVRSIAWCGQRPALVVPRARPKRTGTHTLDRLDALLTDVYDDPDLDERGREALATLLGTFAAIGAERRRQQTRWR